MTVPIAVRSQWDQPNSPKENADAYTEVAAGEAQTSDPIMRRISGETERPSYRNVGRSGKTDPPRVRFVNFGAGLLTLSQFDFGSGPVSV